MSKGTPEEIQEAAIELEHASQAIRDMLDGGMWPTQVDQARVQEANKRYTELTTGEPLRR